MNTRAKLRACAALILVSSGGVLTRAQSIAAPDVGAVALDANLVIVPVTVRDKKGDLVKGLTKENFSLQTGGKELTIRYFDNDINQPMTSGVLVDVSRNMQGALDEEKKASQAFVDTMLSQKSNKAFILHFAHDIELLQDVTADQARLDKAVRELGTESTTFKTTSDEGTRDSEGRQVHGHGTSLYDAVFLVGDELLQSQKGRKALVLITDGIDGGSKESLNDAIEAAQRANIALYAIYIKGSQPQQRQQNQSQRRTSYPGSSPGGYPGGYPSGYPGGNRQPSSNPNDPNSQTCQNNPNDPSCKNNPTTGQPRKSNVDGKQLLERMCGETGGHVFEVSKKLSVEQIYAQIGEELRTQYLLGFTPDMAAAKGGYHQLDLRMTGDYKDQQHDHKIEVQARDGYYVTER